MFSEYSRHRSGNIGLIQGCLAFSLIVLYFSTRLANLTLLPIFTDEAVYILWSQSIAKNISDLWLPVQIENNRPLFFWLTAMSLKNFADPLWAGRAVSIAAGFFTLAGIYFAASRLHSTWAGLLAGFVCIISPYNLFFDRMAHKAALLNCFFVWLVWLTVRMSEPRGKYGVRYYWLLGLLVALSLLTEATGALFVFLPLTAMLFLPKGKPCWKPMMACYLAAIVIGCFPQAYLYFTDDQYQIKNFFIPKNNGLAQIGFVDMVSALPLNIGQNAGKVSEHFTAYLTWPVVLSAMIYFVLSLGKMNRNILILSVYFFLPTLALTGTAGAGFSRYYLFCATPILIWGALGLADILSFIKRAFSRSFAYPVLAVGVPLVFLQAATFDYQLLTSPLLAPLSGTDRYQYVSSEFSGYGSSEAVDYLKKVSQDKKIAVFTTSNWGVPDDCVTIYLSGSSNVDIYMGFWAFKKPLLPPEMESFERYDKFTAKRLGKFNVKDLPPDVYFIARTPSVSRNFFLGMNENFQLIQSFPKPSGTNSIDIYKLIRA